MGLSLKIKIIDVSYIIYIYTHSLKIILYNNLNNFVYETKLYVLKFSTCGAMSEFKSFGFWSISGVKFLNYGCSITVTVCYCSLTVTTCVLITPPTGKRNLGNCRSCWNLIILNLYFFKYHYGNLSYRP